MIGFAVLPLGCEPTGAFHYNKTSVDDTPGPVPGVFFIGFRRFFLVFEGN
jgi:hypothetical protein